MELSRTEVEELELYVDRDVESGDATEIKRVPLKDDMVIGETAYFRSGFRNKIVKWDEDDYMFYRFDDIGTHVDEYESECSRGDIKTKLLDNLDYDLNYASERVGFLKEALVENDWVYDLLSSSRAIRKEHKQKNSFLSMEQPIDMGIQKIADYILHPRFNDKQNEEYVDGLNESYGTLKSKKSKTNSELCEMMALKDEIDLIAHGIISKSREDRNKKREKLTDDANDFEQTGEDESVKKSKSALSHTGKGLEMDREYWNRMGFSVEEGESRQEILDNYNEALGKMVKQLGHGKSRIEKEKIQKKTLEGLEPIKYHNGVKEVVITPGLRFNRISKMYSELKSDYNKTKEILAEIVSFNQMTPATTVYNFNEDTWYIDEDGEEIEVSKNAIPFDDPNTYKGLIMNYYDLKEKHQENFQSDMWYILMFFERLMREAPLSNEERFVIDELMRDSTQAEIVKNFNSRFNSNVSRKTISNWINRVIPNKLLTTYLKSMDEWLYTYKFKGKYKTCNRCREIKLINNDRYFRKHPLGRDGFQPVCKICESFTKKGN